MQMTTEARAWLDATVRRIMARHPLGEPERAGITYELMSHLHAAGEARAQAAGRSEVSREDLEAALAESGGEAGLAAAFVQPLARPVERVLFGRRAVALAIDAVVLGVGLAFVHGVVAALLTSAMGHMETPYYPLGPTWLLPWAFHDPSLHVALQALIGLASVGLILGYFTWTEGTEGRSLGKRAMGLRVVRLDGEPMTYRNALLRNLAKLSPPILAADTLIMLLVFAEEKQRVSDKMAETIVVRA